MIQSQLIAPPDQTLSEETVRQTLQRTLEGQFHGRKVLVLIPDHTRSLPLPVLFRTLVAVLRDAQTLDFLVALGTHPALSEERLCALVGITPEERRTTYQQVGLRNHDWVNESSLTSLGILSQEEIRTMAGTRWHPSLGGDVDVRINRSLLEYDRVLILGPTFPHEVAGFSGGAKYLVPGVSGPSMINVTHWLGALAGVVATIGVKDTPVRAMIHAAAAMLTTPVTLIGIVAEPVMPACSRPASIPPGPWSRARRGDDRSLAGLFIGGLQEAWSAAADLSAQRHIQWREKPYQRVLSCAPPMYDELWTAAKAVYKLEPVMAEGGEIILYAPHLDTISRTHGKYIAEVGYHVLPYFLENWERFREIPLAVLAHSTHVRGAGRMEDGVERPRIRVTLASRISQEDCARLNLGYLDPNDLHPEEWQDREEDGILYIPKAGEVLYRLKDSQAAAGGRIG